MCYGWCKHEVKNWYTYHSSKITICVESYTKQEKHGVTKFLAAEGDKPANAYHKMKVISKWVMVFLGQNYDR
jgi:hypothetical protein